METTSTDTPQAGSDQSSEIISRLRRQQNLPVAIFAGSAAAVLGAILWAVVTVSTGYQIGWMAVGIGFAVGFAVRLGKGMDKIYSIVGATLALLGCLLGNMFALIGFISSQENLDIGQTISAIDFTKVPGLMVSTASPMDFLFYAIAVYEGYKYSCRTLTEEDIKNAQRA